MSTVAIRADVVKQHLTRRNISQNNLALQAGLSRSYLSQIIHHQRSPGPEARRRLMDALHIRDFDELFQIVPDSGEGLT